MNTKQLLRRLTLGALVVALSFPAQVALPVASASAEGAVTAAHVAILEAGSESRTRLAKDRPENWRAAAVADQLIVLTESASNLQEVANETQDLGGETLKTSGSRVLAEIPEGSSRQDFAAELKAVPGVVAVQPNYVYRASRIPNDPLYDSQWGLPKVGAPAAWNVSRGEGVTVAVVDTGVDASNPDLAARLDTVNGYDFVNADRDPTDDEGHGTHIAGIIAATADNNMLGSGVAPEATILPVKVLNRYGDGDSWKVANGITYAADRGADIINLSLGGRNPDEAIEAAIKSANSKGSLVVAATGNSGSSSTDYPARYEGVLGVGAISSSNARPTFSNYGPGLDLVAPGVDIVSTALGGGTDTMSGTSMAAAFVSGAAALVKSAHPDWTGAEVQARLVNSAENIGSSTYFGSGLVRADRALDVDTDDDVPGVPLGPSPAEGALNEASDRHDVRYVDLGAGQTLTVSLNGPVATDFDVALYGPSTGSIGSSPALQDTNAFSSYPKTISFRVPDTGRYYLDIFASSGAGSYSLTWAITGESDDSIPGRVLPGSPFSASLSQTDDPNDVYRVYIEAGEQLSVLMSGAPHGTNFNLYLYGPDAQTLSSHAPVWSSTRSGSSERFRYVARQSGYHYLNARALAGSGPYTITWFKGPFAPDDNVPGVDLVAKPSTGTVNYSSDSDDVYRVWLGAGQRFSAVLDVTGSGVLDLYAYAPSATNVDLDDYVADTETQTAYPRRLGFVAKESGYHFIDVFSHSGSGSYEMNWSIDRHPDDEIPGVRIPTSTLGGSLGTSTDTDDVYRVRLAAGQHFGASLVAPKPTTTSPGTDFSMRLFGPGSTSFRTDTPLLESKRGAYPTRIDFVAPVAGDYYLHLHAYSGTGKYTVSWAYKTMTKVTKSPTGSTYTLRRSGGVARWRLSATVRDYKGRGISGKKMLLQRSANGTSWSTQATMYANTSGYVSKTLTFRSRQVYYWRWYSPSDSKRLSSAASKTKVTVR